MWRRCQSRDISGADNRISAFTSCQLTPESHKCEFDTQPSASGPSTSQVEDAAHRTGRALGSSRIVAVFWWWPDRRMSCAGNPVAEDAWGRLLRGGAQISVTARMNPKVKPQSRRSRTTGGRPSSTPTRPRKTPAGGSRRRRLSSCHSPRSAGDRPPSRSPAGWWYAASRTRTGPRTPTRHHCSRSDGSSVFTTRDLRGVSRPAAGGSATRRAGA